MTSQVVFRARTARADKCLRTAIDRCRGSLRIAEEGFDMVLRSNGEVVGVIGMNSMALRGQLGEVFATCEGQV